MTRMWTACALALALPLVSGAEELLELDISGGESEGHWMMVVSDPLQEGSPQGVAVIAVGEGDAITAAFGMHIVNYRPDCTAVTAEQIAEFRADEKEPETKVVTVKLNPDQYAAAKAVADEYSAKDEFVDRAGDVALNYATAMLNAVEELKHPYRSGLGMANPMLFYEDIGTLNRNKTG